MSTIISPSSSPTVVYADDGTTVDTLTVAGTTQATAAVITRFARNSVVTIVAGGSSTGVSLPSDSEVGDEVEIYNSLTSRVFGALVYGFGSELIDGSPANNGVNNAVKFRKISALDWRTVSAA